VKGPAYSVRLTPPADLQLCGAAGSGARFPGLAAAALQQLLDAGGSRTGGVAPACAAVRPVKHLHTALALRAAPHSRSRRCRLLRLRPLGGWPGAEALRNVRKWTVYTRSRTSSTITRCELIRGKGLSAASRSSDLRRRGRRSTRAPQLRRARVLALLLPGRHSRGEDDLKLIKILKNCLGMSHERVHGPWRATVAATCPLAQRTQTMRSLVARSLAFNAQFDARSRGISRGLHTRPRPRRPPAW
jgi:hypothetical protein